MTLSASETHGIAAPVVLIVALTFAVIYGFGYVRAVMHRANRDYKTTKKALPGLRKGFWRAWWSAVKVGFIVLLIGAALMVWAVRDTESGADATPGPSASSVTPSGHR